MIKHRQIFVTAVIFTAVGAIVSTLQACGSDSVSIAPSDGGALQSDSSSPDAIRRDASTASTCAPPAGACATYSCTKNVYWGDLHMHSSYSLDSYTIANRNDPKDAYAFAKKKATLPIAGAANGLSATIDRALDFLAVTEHSEYLSATGECLLGSSGGAVACSAYNDQGSNGQLAIAAQAGAQLLRPNPEDLTQCQGDVASGACVNAAKTAWQKIQQAASSAYEPCSFTSLVAYEWTANTGGANLHRNVIFGSEIVPDVPFDYIRYPTPISLWQALEGSCDAKAGCEAITIPHNSNFSFGRMWETIDDPAAAAYMAKYQTLAEVFQHKGNSECLAGQSLGDPACAFEEATGSVIGNVFGQGGGDKTQDAPGMVRNGLGRGLAALTKTGVNPIEVGFVGATDTHNGTPGNVKEEGWPGHLAENDDTSAKRLTNGAALNPGGITGVWAEQNTRAAIFAALKRRETFATSGPRIAVRLYALDGLASGDVASLCEDAMFPAALLAKGGVPMGGRIERAKAPTFFVAALKDSVDLVGVDIVKVGVDANGVATSAVKTISLDASQSGAPCVSYTDPDFDGASPSLYYARVYQAPTYRWSHYDCAVSPDAADGGCAPSGNLDVTVQERAWTSPIFFRQ